MVSPFLQKVIVFVLSIAVVVYFGYGLMNKPLDVSSIDQGTFESNTASQDILNLVEKMRNISIDSSVFSSPLFTKLIDISAVITPELKGRPNPFAPIGFDQVVSQAVTLNTTNKVKTTP